MLSIVIIAVSGIAIAVVESTGDKSSYEYGEQLYKDNTDKENGIVLVYDFGENIYNLYRTGNAESIFTNEICQNNLWNTFAYPESYYEGGYAYLASIEEILSKSAPIEETEKATEAEKVTEADSAIYQAPSILRIPICLIIGFVLAFIVVKIQASKLKTVRQKVDAADYVGDVMLTGQSDLFMYKNVRRVEKSSGSSTHTSSSGRTHGGGSRNF